MKVLKSNGMIIDEEILLHAGKWCTWEWKERKVEERVNNLGRSEREYIYTKLFVMKGLDFCWRRGIRNTLVNKV